MNKILIKNDTYGGVGDDMAFSLIQTADGGFALVGRTNSYSKGGLGTGSYDCWLVKIGTITNTKVSGIKILPPLLALFILVFWLKRKRG